MLDHASLAGHLAKLAHNRSIAMLCARACRALGDAEEARRFVDQARIATKLIVNARQLVRA